MAIDLSPLLKDHNARPYHLSVIADIFDGQSEDSYTAGDQSAAIATLKSDVETLTDAAATALVSTLSTMSGNIDSLVDGTTLSSTDKTNLKNSIHGLLGTISPATIFDVLYSNITGKIDDDIPADVVVNKSDVLIAAKDYLDTAIAADATNFPYQDVWCQGAGRYERRRDAGVDPTDTSLKHCDVCDGFGRKATQGEIIIVKPPVTTYP